MCARMRASVIVEITRGFFRLGAGKIFIEFRPSKAGAIGARLRFPSARAPSPCEGA